MEEVFDHPAQVAHWEAYVEGEAMDWERVFARYRSQIDWPGSHVWRELAAAFPKAKILHSERDPEAWWASFSKTIGAVLTGYRDLPGLPHAKAMRAVNHEMIGMRGFGGRWIDKVDALAAYRARADEVRALLPPDRVLFHDVANGWEPLCAFLEVPVPDRPFPRLNDPAQFQANVEIYAPPDGTTRPG